MRRANFVPLEEHEKPGPHHRVRPLGSTALVDWPQGRPVHHAWRSAQSSIQSQTGEQGRAHGDEAASLQPSEQGELTIIGLLCLILSTVHHCLWLHWLRYNSEGSTQPSCCQPLVLPTVSMLLRSSRLLHT
jgi:hypothetical protein